MNVCLCLNGELCSIRNRHWLCHLFSFKLNYILIEAFWPFSRHLVAISQMARKILSSHSVFPAIFFSILYRYSWLESGEMHLFSLPCFSWHVLSFHFNLLSSASFFYGWIESKWCFPKWSIVPSKCSAERKKKKTAVE